MKKHKHPEPLAEIEFWENKARNLNFIFNQLQGEKFRKILKILDQSKSSYNIPFAKLCKQLFLSRSESNENKRYLKPLKKWVLKFENELDYPNLFLLFRPIFQILLLIWKGSRFFNTPTRLGLILREFNNALIKKANKTINKFT